MNEVTKRDSAKYVSKKEEKERIKVHQTIKYNPLKGVEIEMERKKKKGRKRLILLAPTFPYLFPPIPINESQPTIHKNISHY
jgi:hypothetical protein